MTALLAISLSIPPTGCLADAASGGDAQSAEEAVEGKHKDAGAGSAQDSGGGAGPIDLAGWELQLPTRIARSPGYRHQFIRIS